MKTTLSCKAILFDMDGTLIESNDASEAIWKRWTDLRNVPMEKIRAVHHGRRPEETIALVAPELDALKEAQMIYEDQETCLTGIYPIKGANDFYNALPEGSFGIVTAATQKILDTRFGIVGLKPPKVCVTAERLKNGKPDPEGYLQGALRLGFDPKDCIVFEDAPAGLLAAKRAGMRSVAITTHYSVEELRAELGENYEPVLVISDYESIELKRVAQADDRSPKLLITC
jgi:sugar-phosphatase